MINRFEELLGELGIELGLSLHSDRIGACTLNINDEFRIQLETDSRQDHLLIATFVCEIPPGKFRENILCDALKSNAPFPLHGTLAFSDRNNMLALFARLPLPLLSGVKLAAFLFPFVEKAKNWRAGVGSGQTAQLIPSVVKPTGIFPGPKP